MRRFQTARRSRKRARRSSAPWPTSTPNSRAAASRSRTSRGVMRAGPWASRWGRGYECDPQDSRPSPAVERRAGGGRNDEEYPCGISRSSAPRLRRQSAAGRRKRISGHAPSVPNEARHQIRGRLDDAGCVAPPRNSANYSSSSRLASAADPPPTLATDFGSGTLEDLDHHRTAPAEGVERGGPVRPAPHAARAREQPEREDLLAEVAPVEPAPEDGLVHLLQLAEGETGREERVDEVGVRELGTQAAEGAADHGTVIVGEGRQACHRAPGGVRERLAGPTLKAAAVRDEREVRHRHDPAMRIALGVAEGVQLLEVDAAHAGLGRQQAARSALERLVGVHPPARERPAPREYAAPDANQQQLQRAVEDREHRHVDRDRRRLAAGRAHPPSSSMRSSAAAARTRTSSGMVISGARARRASRVPSRVIIFMYWQSLQLL